MSLGVKSARARLLCSMGMVNLALILGKIRAMSPEATTPTVARCLTNLKLGRKRFTRRRMLLPGRLLRSSSISTGASFHATHWIRSATLRKSGPARYFYCTISQRYRGSTVLLQRGLTSGTTQIAFKFLPRSHHLMDPSEMGFGYIRPNGFLCYFSGLLETSRIRLFTWSWTSSWLVGGISQQS